MGNGQPGGDGTDRIQEVEVPARSEGTPFVQVAAGETWTFSAAGRWNDWWVHCGPDGYRNFPADLLSIRPRAVGHPFFRLMGAVGAGAPFAIGMGTTHEFTETGQVTVYANDATGWYGNNGGAVTLRAALGGIPPAPEAPEEGIPGRWHRIRSLWEGTRGIPAAALLSTGACCVLAFTTQGRDLLRTAAEDGASGDAASGLRLLSFAGLLLFLAIQSWFWSRTVIDSNFGLDRAAWRPRWLLVWGPRVLGAAPFALVIGALVGASDPSLLFVAALAVLGLAFFAGVVWRQDALVRLRGRRGLRQDEPPWPFGRWWAILSLALVPATMALATVAPVALGQTLGAPAVVFLGIAMIIPVMVTVVQVASAMRLPVVGVVLAAAAAFSLWNDNHAVGRRAFAPMAQAAPNRIDLKSAYAGWRKAQPPGQPLTMVLVASEGGASRAGYWTAEVLAAMHERSGGRLATSTFAINAVSGGSVGAVGYAALLHDGPHLAPGAIRAPLEAFAGREALGPVMAGALFPDLLQRILPFPLLPDRAEALERAWEAAWTGSCTAGRPGCSDPDLMSKPFTSLGPMPDGAWQPIVIVQGASEETGRRILTSRLVLEAQDVDADDFYALAGHDVAASTAIHNGARFPWISPAGKLGDAAGKQGHIVDGGYFDAAGVEVVRELARAVLRVQEPREPIRFVYVFIGYGEATKDAQTDVAKAQRLPGTEQPPRAEGTGPEQQGQTQEFVNEARAPVYALLQSRGAHGAHLMRDLKLAASPPGSQDVDPFTPASRKDPDADYVPVILCDKYVGSKKVLELPLDWALSRQAKDFMRSATGSGTDPGCGCGMDSAHCTATAIETVARLIGGTN